MAVASFTVLATTPYRIRYQLVADGAGGGTQNRTRTQMIADCANGPLKAFLQRLTTMAGFTTTNRGVSLFCRTGLGPATGQAQVTDFDANSIDFTGTVALTVAIFEIAFNHTFNR